MQLFYSARSPFVRKVLVVAAEKGLAERIEKIPVDPWKGEARLFAANPLSKVPTLIADDGLVIYDSAVICEYLDEVGGGPSLVPHAGRERLLAMRLETLADGVMESAVLRRMEITRPQGEQSPSWARMQADMVTRGLDALEQEAGQWSGLQQVGQIAAACALGYLDFRFATEEWRVNRPRLAEWYGRVSQRPSLKNTEPRD